MPGPEASGPLAGPRRTLRGGRSANWPGQGGEAVERRGQFVSPGPGRRDPQAEAVSVAGEAAATCSSR